MFLILKYLGAKPLKSLEVVERFDRDERWPGWRKGSWLEAFRLHSAQLGRIASIENVTGRAFVASQMMLSQGLPEDQTLQNLLDFVFGFFGAGEPTTIEEVTLFDAPALRSLSSISFEGEPEHPFEATMGILDDRIFILVLHSSNEDEMEQFLPTWR
jgi:hypothetical protein